uniref:alpha-L-rhamnosidase C-terminal domain-containing protein n=1 Tax=uncultured Proteiniphilum sp. TaxID=497637 RepID=UPI00263924C8
FLYRKVAGLNIASGEDAAGYKHILIKPCPGGSLKHARATLKTYYGTVTSGWQLNDEQMEMTVEVPVNTRATVYLPSTTLKNITEGGKPIDLITEITIPDLQEDNYTVIQVGSGKYQFKIQTQ